VTVKGHSVNGASLYGGSVRGTWQEGSFSGSSETYVHVKEGSGNGASLFTEAP